MPSFEDISAFFDDFALASSWTPSTGGPLQPGQVILDEPDTMFLGDIVVNSETTLTFPVSQWVGADEGQIVVVDGVRYRFRQRPQAFDDGQLVRVEVVKV